MPRRCSSHSALMRWLRAGPAASAAAANNSTAHRKLSLHRGSQGLQTRGISAHRSMRCQPARQAWCLTVASAARQAARRPASAAAGGCVGARLPCGAEHCALPMPPTIPWRLSVAPDDGLDREQPISAVESSSGAGLHSSTAQCLSSTKWARRCTLWPPCHVYVRHTQFP